MIANAYLNEWRQTVPWSDNKMVEQDLIISRLLVELFNHPHEIAGVDLFIADEDYLKKGYATLALTNFIKEYVQGKFILLVTDPLKINKNAIQFFERNGFKKLPSNLPSSINELLVLHVA